MPRRIAGNAGAAGLAALCLAAAAHAAPIASSIPFDEIFTDRGEPARMHFRATYTAGGQPHEVEAWREGSTRLRRRADAAVENFVFQDQGDTDWRMTVLDIRRKIRSDLDRDSLLRLGQFTDWFSLAHGIARPVGAYTLKASATPPRLPVQPIGACRWYELAQAGRSSSICWSEALRLPLVIADGAGVQWRIVAADAVVPKDAFVIRDEGFAKNDAAADIKGD